MEKSKLCETDKLPGQTDALKKREAFMVRLRKDKKDKVLNEKRRKLYVQDNLANL